MTAHTSPRGGGAAKDVASIQQLKSLYRRISNAKRVIVPPVETEDDASTFASGLTPSSAKAMSDALRQLPTSTPKSRCSLHSHTNESDSASHLTQHTPRATEGRDDHTHEHMHTPHSIRSAGEPDTPLPRRNSSLRRSSALLTLAGSPRKTPVLAVSIPRDDDSAHASPMLRAARPAAEACTHALGTSPHGLPCPHDPSTSPSATLRRLTAKCHGRQPTKLGSMTIDTSNVGEATGSSRQSSPLLAFRECLPRRQYALEKEASVGDIHGTAWDGRKVRRFNAKIESIRALQNSCGSSGMATKMQEQELHASLRATTPTPRSFGEQELPAGAGEAKRATTPRAGGSRTMLPALLLDAAGDVACAGRPESDRSGSSDTSSTSTVPRDALLSPDDGSSMPADAESYQRVSRVCTAFQRRSGPSSPRRASIPMKPATAAPAPQNDDDTYTSTASSVGTVTSSSTTGSGQAAFSPTQPASRGPVTPVASRSVAPSVPSPPRRSSDASGSPRGRRTSYQAQGLVRPSPILTNAPRPPSTHASPESSPHSARHRASLPSLSAACGMNGVAESRIVSNNIASLMSDPDWRI